MCVCVCARVCAFDELVSLLSESAYFYTHVFLPITATDFQLLTLMHGLQADNSRLIC